MSAPVAFGRYVLLDKLASGGMAELFFAKVQGAAGFEKACVIKRVLPHLAESEDFVEMFLDEARIAARLSHPGIVQVFDLGRQDADYFIAMEYLAGEDVQAILQRCHELGRRMPIRIAVRIAARAAEALHYAHDLTLDDGTPLNLVHRDVTPSNLFVTYQGAVKVLDFGIARARTQSRMTQAGQVKGKLPYMAPEQLRGRALDRRVDLWALAVTLHEMLTGERLFSGPDARAIADAIHDGPLPPPSALRPEIPRAVSDAVMRALSRDPAQRTGDAETFREELEQALVEVKEEPASLGAFLSSLFGPERANERLRRGAAAPQRSSPPTEALGPAAAEPSRSPSTKRADPGTVKGEGSARPTRSLRKPRASASGGTELATAPDAPGSDASGTQTQPQGLPADPRETSGAANAQATSGGVSGPNTSSERRPVSLDSAVVTMPLAALSLRRRARWGIVALALVGAVLAGGAWWLTRPGAPGRSEPKVAASTVSQSEAPTIPPPPPGASSSPTPARMAPSSKSAPASPEAPAIAARAPAPTRAAPALLEIEANVPSDVWIDGEPVGSVPIERKLRPGAHRVRIVTSAGARREESVTLGAGGHVSKRFVFGKGTLNVDAEPWADVFLDGESIGQTPLAGREVWEGRHSVRLVGPHAEKTVQIAVAAGKTTIVDQRLEP